MFHDFSVRFIHYLFYFLFIYVFQLNYKDSCQHLRSYSRELTKDYVLGSLCHIRPLTMVQILFQSFAFYMLLYLMHYMCCRHFYSNFRKKFSGHKLKKLIWKTATVSYVNAWLYKHHILTLQVQVCQHQNKHPKLNFFLRKKDFK